MNRFLRNRLIELFKAVVFLALGYYLGALYATHEIAAVSSIKDLSIARSSKSNLDENNEKSKRSKAFLTVFVVSAPDNKEKRDVLRKTWPSS